MLNYLCSIYQLIVREGKKTMNNKLLPNENDTQIIKDYKLYSQAILTVKDHVSSLWGAVNLLDARLDAVLANEKKQHEASQRFIKEVFSDEKAGKKSKYYPRTKPNKTDKQVIRELSRGHFVAIPTMAGSLGKPRQSIYASIFHLQKMGYPITVKTVSGVGRRYRKIYKLEEGKQNHA